jgi:VWFA-related protein
LARSVVGITTTAAILLLGRAVLEPPLHGQQAPPTIRSRTTLVPIDIRVVDLSGNPVKDLKEEDFTVQEDGIRQEIRLFDAHALTSEAPQPGRPALRRAQAAGAPLTAQNQRIFLFVFGRGRLQSPEKGIDWATRFVRDRLLPQDRVAVMAYNRATAVIALSAQNAPQQPPSFRSGIEVVRLNVSILDKDRRPIRNLTREDITILVDGQPQPIVSFEPVALPRVETPTAAWMRDIAPDVRNNALGEPRLFVILMDDATTPTDPGMVATAKKVAHGIIDQMGPSDLAAVVFTMKNSHAQEFTGDRRLLRAAVDQFTFGMRGNPLGAIYSKRTLEGVLATLRDRPDGRNAIMLVSANPVSSEEVSAMGLELRAMADMITDLGAIERAARLAPVPIYGFNIAGLVTANAGADRRQSTTSGPFAERPYTDTDARGANEMFRTLADMTGGRAIVDDNEPARRVSAVFDEMSAYYMIGYRPTYPAADGKPRKLQIHVDRPGVTVLPSERLLSVARPKKKTEPEASPLLKAVADLLPKSEMPVAVTAAPFVLSTDAQSKGPSTGLLTTLHVSRAAPPDTRSEEIQVLAKVFTPEGKPVGTGRQTATLSLRPTGRDAHLDVLLPIPLKPGRYNLRISAHSVDLDKTGSVYTDVTIPDFAKDPLSLSGVVIGVEPMPMTAPRDAFVAIIPVVPTTRRDFERSDRATAFVRIYRGAKAPAGRVDVTARVTDANGAQLHSKTDLVAAEAFGKTRSADYTCGLPISTLPPGAYLLTIEVTLGSVTSRRDVRFSVR